MNFSRENAAVTQAFPTIFSSWPEISLKNSGAAFLFASEFVSIIENYNEILYAGEMIKLLLFCSIFIFFTL